MQGEWLRKPAGETSVVFVHGILSSGEQCWRNRNGMYWPELLQQEPELAALGIYVYTYQTGVFSGSYSISDIVDDLKERLFYVDKVINHHQIIFVCHSMGGIVVRKFIVERILEINRQNLSIGLFLVASPSLGSDYANCAKLIANLVGNVQAKALGFSQENNWLNDLDKAFKNIKGSEGLNIQGKELIEDQPIIFKKLFKKQIVEPFSAARYFGDPYKVPGSDHSSIAKPENKEAIQHRLLVKFIEKIIQQESTSQVRMVNAFPTPNPQPSLSSQPPPIDDSSKSADEIKKWQDKLTKRLAEQLKRTELEPVSESFASKLREDFPGLPQDWESIARYLVMGQGDRQKQVAQFLTAAQQYPVDKLTEEPVKNLMAYLLQILVRKCHEEDDKGLTRIPVDQIHSVKLVGATRTTFPYIPNVSPTDNQEHENGQKSASFQNIGHFLPETGELENPDKICQVIAYELLLGLGESPVASDNKLLEKLSDKLSAYSDAPENAPVQGLYVKQGAGHNPLQIDAVASALRKVLGDFLWVYIYGGQDSNEWLHAEEGRIEGLISRYNRDVVKQKPTQQSPVQEDSKNSEIKTAPSVFVSYSHDDRSLVLEFVKRFKQSGFQVVIDDTHLQAGEDIASFIHRSINETNATICIVSRSSLLSPWVAMETVNTFDLQKWSDSKKFIACFLEDDFFKPAFRVEATQKIDEKISEINALIPEYNDLKLDTNDLNEDKTRLIKLRNDLGLILQRLKNSLSLDIRPAYWEASLERLCKDFKMD